MVLDFDIAPGLVALFVSCDEGVVAAHEPEADENDDAGDDGEWGEVGRGFWRHGRGMK